MGPEIPSSSITYAQYKQWPKLDLFRAFVEKIVREFFIPNITYRPKGFV